MRQIVIAIDQLINTFVPPYAGPKRGWADETLSSRAWRRSAESKGWARFQVFVDWLFLKILQEKDHCFESWVSESLRRHMPPQLRYDQTPQGDSK